MRTERIESLVDDRPGDKIFRVHRDVFADPELFELEMKHVFGKTWCFLGAESQVSKPHEYITSWIGRTARPASHQLPPNEADVTTTESRAKKKATRLIRSFRPLSGAATWITWLAWAAPKPDSG